MENVVKRGGDLAFDIYRGRGIAGRLVSQDLGDSMTHSQSHEILDPLRYKIHHLQERLEDLRCDVEQRLAPHFPPEEA